MFAGGRVWRHGALRIGSEATRRTWQASSARKQGRSGPLHFVTVRTEVSQGGQVVITEEQDLVYREPGANGPARSAESVAAAGRDRTVAVDPVLLFRFSALTYNAHRIHYDRDYARAEGYPGLVVHGPLQALLMAELARPGRVRVRVPAGRAAVRGPGPDRVGCSGRRRGPGVVPRRRGPRYRYRPDQLALLS